MLLILYGASGEILDTDTCILQGIKTEYGSVSNLDLQLARILHRNNLLQIPVARSHLIKYARNK